jgi:hypothetical protein
MNVTKTRTGALLLILMLLLAACGGGSDESESTAPASTDAPAAATAVPPTEPPASGGEEPTSGGEEPTAETEAPPPEPTAEPAGSVIPYDIAIIEGAVDLDIQETMISYRLEGFEMGTAADFYKNFMAEQGWNILTDSTIGVMGTLVFESDEARVSVKLQSNTFAETVDVTILVFHK